MSPAGILAWIPLVRELVELGQGIADRVRARRAARKAPPCPPPVKLRSVKRKTGSKDGKR